jgi:hypothetical protein
MKKTPSEPQREESHRRVLARVLADNLHDVHGSATWTTLDGPAPDVPTPVSSPLSEASSNESTAD